MTTIRNKQDFELWLKQYRRLWYLIASLIFIAGVCIGVWFHWELVGLVSIVKTYHRKEKLLDTRNVNTIEGMACPYCPNEKRFTGKNIVGTDRKLIYCGVCGASFYEDEGRGHRK